MSLNVDWSKVSPPPTEAEQDRDAFNVGMVLWICGLNKLETAADVHEILTRVRFYEKLSSGPLIRDGDGNSLSATADFWKRWSGVRVNVGKETRAAWLKRITTQIAAEIDRKVSDEL